MRVDAAVYQFSDRCTDHSAKEPYKRALIHNKEALLQDKRALFCEWTQQCASPGNFFRVIPQKSLIKEPIPPQKSFIPQIDVAVRILSDKKSDISTKEPNARACSTRREPQFIANEWNSTTTELSATSGCSSAHV